MVQTGMTTPYTAFGHQNDGHVHNGHHGGHVSPLKPEMKGTQDGGGGGGGHPPNGVNQVRLNARTRQLSLSRISDSF